LKTLSVIVIVIVVGAALLFYFGVRSETGSGAEFITVAVEKGALRAEITCTGTLSPLVEVLVGSQVSGTIKELNADFESRVEKGQVVALIDPALFEAKVAQAKADLEAAQAALDKARVTLADERRNLERHRGLIRKNSISQSEFDTVKTKADAAEAQVGVERARKAQMEAKLREAALQLKYTRIVTPVSGVVTSRSVDVGQTVAAGFQAPVLFKIAEDLRKMQVNTNVDEADIGRVRIGQKAVFSVPAFPDDTFTASVRQIRNEPTIEQNVVTYNVVLDVDNSDLKLRPGMTANVMILLEEVKDALMVPDRVLRFTPSAEFVPGGDLSKLPPLKRGEKRVWKRLSQKAIRPVTVRVGISGTERVQIVSTELRPGDRVVVEAVHKKKKRTRGRALRFRF